jgi:hypothetical protein
MSAPLRTHMAPEGFYEKLDPGIRFAVRVLHANGIETGQSCQGGEGHCYDRPTVDLWGEGADGAPGFAALHALEQYGLRVESVALHWTVERGLPFQRFWRIALAQAWPERASERPMFVHGYMAASPSKTPEEDSE